MPIAFACSCGKPMQAKDAFAAWTNVTRAILNLHETINRL
jgi:hypothetical protein